MIARVGCENRHPSHEAPALQPEKVRTYIVARNYEDGHWLTRFVRTDDEKELRKHWTRIARLEDMHNGFVQLAACGNNGAVE
jgi:hypothetical protein